MWQHRDHLPGIYRASACMFYSAAFVKFQEQPLSLCLSCFNAFVVLIALEFLFLNLPTKRSNPASITCFIFILIFYFLMWLFVLLYQVFFNLKIKPTM